MENKMFFFKNNRNFQIKINILKNKYIYLSFFYLIFYSEIYNQEFQIDFQDVFEKHNMPRLIINIEDGSITMANKGVVEFYGYELDTLLTMNIRDINILSKEQVEKEWKSASANAKNRFRFPHKLADGTIKNVEVFSYPITYDNKEYLYSVIVDISKEINAIKNLEKQKIIIMFLAGLSVFLSGFSILLMYKLKEKYKDLAVHDPLTGLYSREYLKLLSNESENKNHKESSIVMIDINDFKKINDTYGHLMGDKVLKKVAESLMNNLREKDSVIRYGGDEFLLILSNIDVNKAEEIMGRIACKIFDSKEFEFLISLSYGVASWNESINIEEIIKFADEKMYQMKKQKAKCELRGDKFEK